MILTIEEAKQVVNFYHDLEEEVKSTNFDDLDFQDLGEDDEYIDKYVSLELDNSEDNLCVEFGVSFDKTNNTSYVSEDICIYPQEERCHSIGYYLNEIMDFIKENE